jgi:Uracil DNA glycosylase superfamily
LDDEQLRRLTDRPDPGSHRVTALVDGVPVETLADLPPAPNGILFVGEAPSRASIVAGHHGQDPAGQALWSRLLRAGILPRGTTPGTADDALLAMGHGFAVLCAPRAAATDGSPYRPTDAELTAGVGPLWQRIALWRPAAIVFVSNRAARAAAGRPLPVPWGVLPDVALAGRPCILLPPADAADESERVAIDLLRNLLASLPR